MYTSRLLRLIPFCLVLVVSVSAQQAASTSSAPATSDPQAIALVQRSLAALTGSGSDDETGTATLTATSLRDSRMDLSFPSGNRREIRNHAAIPLASSLPAGIPAPSEPVAQPIGAWSGPDGVTHGMASHNILTDATWFFPALALGNLVSSPAYVVSYFGKETRTNSLISAVTENGSGSAV